MSLSHNSSGQHTYNSFILPMKRHVDHACLGMFLCELQATAVLPFVLTLAQRWAVCCTSCIRRCGGLVEQRSVVPAAQQESSSGTARMQHADSCSWYKRAYSTASVAPSMLISFRQLKILSIAEATGMKSLLMNLLWDLLTLSAGSSTNTSHKRAL